MTSMDIRKSLDIPRYQWFHGLHGYPRISMESMDIHGFYGMHGYPWISIGHLINQLTIECKQKLLCRPLPRPPTHLSTHLPSYQPTHAQHITAAMCMLLQWPLRSWQAWRHPALRSAQDNCGPSRNADTADRCRQRYPSNPANSGMTNDHR